jgi:phosphoglycolate phosphatase
MNIFLDFDGTLIDVSERYYRVHEAALGATKPQLTREDYWQLKRRHIPEADIIRQHYADVDVENYAQERNTLIECPRFLRYDTLLPQAVPALEILNQAGHRLYLLTLRRSEHNLRAEVDSLGLGPYFRLILTAPSDAQPWEVKAELLRPYAQRADWIVGDTEADIRAGQMLGLHTCAVASGIRTEELLRLANPERSLPSIETLPLLL